MHGFSSNSYLLEKLIQSSNSIVFIYNPQKNQFIYLNSAFEKTWQMSIAKVLTDPEKILATLHPEDKAYLQENYQKFIQGKENTQVEFRIVRPDSSVQWICLTPHFITDERGTRLVAGYAEDVTGQKENIETALKFSSKKNSILETLSHDLMGPLNMISSIAGLLRKKIQSYNDTNLDELVSMIETTCGKNATYIRDFLNQEYLESANVVLNKRRVNLREKVETVLEEYRQMPGNQDKNFQLVASKDDIFMAMDELKFIQLINNLISNAIKFTADNGEISIRLEEKDDTIQITVSDNGIGIPKHLQPILFDKFTKARRPGLHGEEPTGLGMSIVKQVVELHGGQIRLESEENKGTTFFITIPRQNSDQE